MNYSDDDFLNTEAFAWCKGKSEEHDDYDDFSHKLDWVAEKPFVYFSFLLIILLIIAYFVTH